MFAMFNAKTVTREIVDWIKAYFDANGKGCPAVVGISGGKDSSVVAALCVAALGREKVLGVLMPQGEQHDINVSYELVKHLGINHKVINISGIVDAAHVAYQGGLTAQAVYNIPARVRMVMLYAVSASMGGRVANTSNLSEDWIGWATKFGDSAGDFSPLSNLTVTEVLAVGKELGLPDLFINKIPEDGLTGKTDEENFGFSYAVLDRYIRENICEDKALKNKIDRMHKNNVHKVQLMPSYKLG